MTAGWETVAWRDDAVVLLDQRRLPGEEVYLTLREAGEVADAIRGMAVRGAPAIGVTAAFGLALGATRIEAKSWDEFEARFEDLCRLFAATRPTAVNLFWAIDRMRTVLQRHRHASPSEAARVLVGEAQRLRQEDERACRALGRHGAELLGPSSRILTHCNAGGLATAGYGTALGVIRAAHERGRVAMVYADETRPFLQGARLTAWELAKDGIPVTVITDSMAGHFLHKGGLHAVIVGADRIAANGDTANKIGTYGVAVLARQNDVPFYVAAPMSTVDLSTPDGDGIPIEQRDPAEVTQCGDRTVTPAGVAVANPAFDVTPADLITAIITELGVARPPYAAALRDFAAAAAAHARA